MRNIIYIVVLLLSFSSLAQKKENIGINLEAYVPEQSENITDNVKTLLLNKLKQIITKNGFR